MDCTGATFDRHCRAPELEHQNGEHLSHAAAHQARAENHRGADSVRPGSTISLTLDRNREEEPIRQDRPLQIGLAPVIGSMTAAQSSLTMNHDPRFGELWPISSS